MGVRKKISLVVAIKEGTGKVEPNYDSRETKSSKHRFR